MNEISLRDVGKMLAQARHQARCDVGIDGRLVATMDEAETVRAVATELFDEPIAGYKIGATSPEAQKIMGCTEPFYAPIFASAILPSGCEYATPEGFLGVEGEFAFVLSEDLPAHKAPFGTDDIASAVASCHAALELLARRSAGPGIPSLFLAIADMGLNAANILADPAPDWRDADLAATEVRAFVDGVADNSGWGRNAMDGPLNALAWLAAKLAGEGDYLRAGQTILTGTCLGVIAAQKGSLVEVDFGWLGRVDVRLA